MRRAPLLLWLASVFLAGVCSASATGNPTLTLKLVNVGPKGAIAAVSAAAEVRLSLQRSGSGYSFRPGGAEDRPERLLAETERN